MEATDDDDAFGLLKKGDVFPDPPTAADNRFAIIGKVHEDGTARGTATFVFGEEFSAKWGADVIKLKCKIETGEISDDGTIVFKGRSFETDFLDGVVIFEEETPFEIVVNDVGLFTLRWCQLPTFDLTGGHLRVK